MTLATMKLANRSKVYTSVSIVFDNRENCKQCQPCLNGLVSTGVRPISFHKPQLFWMNALFYIFPIQKPKGTNLILP